MKYAFEHSVSTPSKKNDFESVHQFGNTEDDEHAVFQSLCNETRESLENMKPELLDAFDTIFGSDVQYMAGIGAKSNRDRSFFFDALRELKINGEIREQNAKEIERVIALETGGEYGMFYQPEQEGYVAKMRGFMWGMLVKKYQKSLGDLSPQWREHSRVH